MQGPMSESESSSLTLFSNKPFVIRDRIYKMLDRIANMEDPDQTAFVCQCPFWQSTWVHIL